MKTLVVDLGRSSVRYGTATDDGELTQFDPIDLPEGGGFFKLVERLASAADIHFPEDGLLIAAPGPFFGGAFRGLDMEGWWFTIGDLRERFTPAADVVHDVIAGALALPFQRRAARIAIPETGVPLMARNPRAFVQTGVGLGAAAIIPTSEQSWLPISGEGGSATIAPLSDLEDRVFQGFRKQPGIWDFPTAQDLLSAKNLGRYVAILTERKCDLGARAIIESARAGDDHCTAALTAYAGFLGTFASDVALMFRAYDGVSIAGWLPERLTAPEHAVLVERFRKDGPVSEQLKAIPLDIIYDQFHSLVGLTWLATQGMK